jgi:RNA polymerase sigma-70 factor (ECF subfamily)
VTEKGPQTVNDVMGQGVEPRGERENLREFEALYEAELDYVWRSLRRLGIRNEDLEDLTHDVFAKAFHRFETYDASRPLRPWLFGIALRVASDFRQLSRHRHEFQTQIADPLDPIDQQVPADERLDDERNRVLLERALSGLTMERRAILVMHDVNGHSMPEIAEVIALPLNTLYSRLRLARADLQREFQRCKKERP